MLGLGDAVTERVPLEGAALLVYRPDPGGDPEAETAVAMRLANETGLLVLVLVGDASVEALSEAQLAAVGLQRIDPVEEVP